MDGPWIAGQDRAWRDGGESQEAKPGKRTEAGQVAGGGSDGSFKSLFLPVLFRTVFSVAHKEVILPVQWTEGLCSPKILMLKS